MLLRTYWISDVGWFLPMAKRTIVFFLKTFIFQFLWTCYERFSEIILKAYSPEKCEDLPFGNWMTIALKNLHDVAHQGLCPIAWNPLESHDILREGQ
jgi:hypothetical protein